MRSALQATYTDASRLLNDFGFGDEINPAFSHQKITELKRQLGVKPYVILVAGRWSINVGDNQWQQYRQILTIGIMPPLVARNCLRTHSLFDCIADEFSFWAGTFSRTHAMYSKLSPLHILCTKQYWMNRPVHNQSVTTGPALISPKKAKQATRLIIYYILFCHIYPEEHCLLKLEMVLIHSPYSKSIGINHP